MFKYSKYTVLSALFLKQDMEREIIFRKCAMERVKKRGRKARRNIRIMPRKALERHLEKRILMVEY